MSSGRIPQTFIDQLLSRTDIIELINGYLPLKKAGSNYKACCPFHGEKTPSFSVSSSKQFYHCFGCGAHGSAISFLMEYEQLEFVEAIELLAQNAHMEVVREQGHSPRKPDETDLYALLEKCSDYYRQQLKQTPKAIDYLKQRGLSGQIAAQFQLGYAPDGWHTLEQLLGQTKQRELLKSGMLIENDEGRIYDRFRARIMFPIHDYRGRVIAFGGRVLDDSAPKYLNSPETPLFHKGRELYALYHARKSEKQLPHILVVEGYMDVVALAQQGIHNAVATLGTATSGDHIQRLFKASSEIIFCFDGDRAGKQAAWRALENTLPHLSDGREAKFLFLPDGEDPDSLVQKIGQEDFLAQLSQATPLADYLLDSLKQQVDLASIAGRAQLAELCTPHIGSLKEGFYKTLLKQRLSDLIQLTEKQVNQQLRHSAKHELTPTTKRSTPENSLSMTPIRSVIALLLQQPDLFNEIDPKAAFLKQDIPGIELLAQLLNIIQQSPNIHTAALLERFRDQPAEHHLIRLCQWQPATLSEGDPEELENETEELHRLYFQHALQQLQTHYEKERLQQLTRQPQPLSASEKEELRSLLRS
ncbi:MAG: DNA primase [Gammaproteobacteria bacterium]|nr:DNA primase [Gammaproteobacteria bacterium]